MMKTRDKISLIASRLFHEKGFAATSVREIAAAVGIEAASLYNHINSKSDLLDHICFETARKFADHLQEVETSSTPSVKKLVDIFQFHIDMALHDPKVLTVFSQEWRHLPAMRQTEFQRQRKDYEKRVQQIIEEGQKKLEIDPELDPEVLVKMLLSSIQWVYFAKPSSALKAEKRIRHTVELFIQNIVEKLTSVSIK